ncbi:MAG: transporter [Thermodesulfobacteriota bacterium]
MNSVLKRWFFLYLLCLCIFLPSLPISAQDIDSSDTQDQPASSMSLQELSSEIINPLAKIWRLDFENDTFYNTGDIGKKVWTNTLTFRPRLPVSLGDWVLLIQPQVPLVDTEPKFEESILRGITVRNVTGFGDTILATLLGREFHKDIEIGIGPTFVLPTATKNITGQGKWQAGPAASIFYVPKGWTFGVIPQVWWSFAGDSDREDTNQMEIQYIIARHFKGGWNIRSRPTIKADFKADPGDKWNVPVGGGISKLIKIHKVPVLIGVEAQYSIIKQDTFGPEWTISSDITVVIPNPQLLRKAKKQRSKQAPGSHPNTDISY